jgi:hypothetical protein
MLHKAVVQQNLIIFRNYLRCFVENLYNKLPKYEDGVKAFNIKYSIRPIFFGALGLIIIVFSIAGIIIQLD